MHEIADSSKYIRVYTFGSFYQRWDIFNFNPRHTRASLNNPQISSRNHPLISKLQPCLIIGIRNKLIFYFLRKFSQEIPTSQSKFFRKRLNFTPKLSSQVLISSKYPFNLFFKIMQKPSPGFQKES